MPVFWQKRGVPSQPHRSLQRLLPAPFGLRVLKVLLRFLLVGRFEVKPHILLNFGQSVIFELQLGLAHHSLPDAGRLPLSHFPT